MTGISALQADQMQRPLTRVLAVTGRLPIDGDHPLLVGSGRRWRPAHGTVSRKALLDFLPPEQIRQIPATGLETVTAKTIFSPETLRQQVAEIHHRRHAIEIEDQAGFGPMTTGCDDRSTLVNVWSPRRVRRHETQGGDDGQR